MNVVCVWWGDKYGYEYVERLERMVASNLSIPYTFHCISHEHLDDYDLEGVWNKLALFDIFTQGTTLFFDLDVVIQNNIDDFINYPQRDLMVIDGVWKEGDVPINSSIMLWKGDQSHIWEYFNQDPDRFMCTYRGMDPFLYTEGFTLDFLPHGLVYSRLGGRDHNRDYYEYVKQKNGFHIECYYYPEYKVCLFNGDTDEAHYRGFEHYWA